MKYGPLRDYLSGLPESRSEITLRFAEIEKVIGARLPRSAFDYQAWWGNQDYGVQAPAWMGAGFLVDAVDLSRRTVRFRRGRRTTQGRKAGTPKSARTRVKLAANELIEAGFQRCGCWTTNAEGSVRFVGDIPKAPGVYAFALDDVVVYVGVATMGLKKRLNSYGRPGASQLTNIRINSLIAKELTKGREFELLVAVPGETEWNGLPVDIASGLELGLIREYLPPWNKRGVASWPVQFKRECPA